MMESAESIFIINLPKGSESQQCNGHGPEHEVFICASALHCAGSLKARRWIINRMWDVSQC